MKKFIAMLLALVMVLSLVACGDKKDDAAGTDDSESRSRFSQAVPSAASATRSSSRWTTAWISPPARTPC